MQIVRPIADSREDSNSEPMERAAVSRRLPSSDRRAADLAGVALAIGALLLFFDRIASSARVHLLAVDYRQTFLPAAEAILHGHSPYPDYGYPPLIAFVSIPFALLGHPQLFVTAAMIACLPLAVLLVGVRDWRCYVAVFLWSPVFNGVQAANVTLPMLVGVAACWRWRESAGRCGAAAGLSIAAKIIAWPLVVWLAATRRLRAAVVALAVAAGVTFGLWAILGFSGLLSYPSSLNQLQGAQRDNGYTLQALASDAGLPHWAASLVAWAAALLVLGAVFAYGRRGDDARAYLCAVVAFLVASPIVWLHSFAFLIAPLGVLRPRLSLLWLLPATLWFYAPGTGNGAPWQTVLTLAAMGFLVAALLRSRPEEKPATRTAAAGVSA